jgi:carboxypeptidase Taq
MTPSATIAEPYPQLLAQLREIATLSSAASVLAWDQETLMPPAGSEQRAREVALLTSLAHARLADARIGELIEAAAADPELREDPDAAANLRELRRDHERATRLPGALVREFAEVSSLAKDAWRDARERDDFQAFAPWLERIVELSRRRAEHLGVPEGGEVYDALLDEYEPGMRAARVDEIFGELRPELSRLVAAIADAPRKPDPARAELPVPRELQLEFNRTVAARMGFDFGAGRLDTSTHPFCSGNGPGDTRLTTRFRDTGFLDALSSTMHEVGHGLYEQGLPKRERLGEPLAAAASHGIHESQSRLWENMVGRSREFWEWALPEAKAAFSGALGGLTLDEVHGAANHVAPGLIRVESDEVTYNLHIMLRFDLERAILSGELPVAEIPGAWNERMRSDLGLEVPDDRRGCLQDIHWAMGGIGYFPTYTLGNLYAAQLWASIGEQLPGLDEEVRKGEFGSLLSWLRREVHQHGRRYAAEDLCMRATGAPLQARPLLDYLQAKLGPLYGV